MVSRGVRVGDRSFFAVGEFLLGRTETAACLTVGEGLCVRPGAFYLLVAGEAGAPLERVEVAPQGLPDSIAAQIRWKSVSLRSDEIAQSLFASCSSCG